MIDSLANRSGSSPRVCHLATTRFGGAGIAAARLHDALHRVGVSSLFATYDRLSSPVGGYVSVGPEPRSLAHRLAARLRIAFTPQQRWDSRLQSLELNGVFVSGPFGRRNLPRLPFVRAAEIVHLHWVAGLLAWETFFDEVRKPLVWTLHDMQPFMGIFHYAVDRDQAGERARELNDRIQLRKTQLLRSLLPEQLTVITPSRWLHQLSLQSDVLGRFRHRVIPYGLDTSVFRPWPADVARELLGLPAQGRLLLVVAERLDDYRKGLDLAIGALARPSVLSGWSIVAAGSGCVQFPGREVYSVGTLSDPRLMALLYSAVDLMLVPSREDNLPNVILESLCCGTPLVVTPAGGCPEPIVDGRDGVVSRHLSADSLAEALQTATELAFDRELIAAAAKARYDQSVTAAAYLSLYRTLVAQPAAADSDPMRLAP